MLLSVRLFSSLLFLISGNLLAMEANPNYSFPKIDEEIEKIEKQLKQLELKAAGNAVANDLTDNLLAMEVNPNYAFSKEEIKEIERRLEQLELKAGCNTEYQFEIGSILCVVRFCHQPKPEDDGKKKSRVMTCSYFY